MRLIVKIERSSLLSKAACCVMCCRLESPWPRLLRKAIIC